MSYRSRRPAAPPRFMKAKFAGVCAETNQPIKVGDDILYDPKERKAYCEASEFYKSFASAEFDRVMLGQEY